MALTVQDILYVQCMGILSDPHFTSVEMLRENGGYWRLIACKDGKLLKTNSVSSYTLLRRPQDKIHELFNFEEWNETTKRITSSRL
jgi:hypothetical protein